MFDKERMHNDPIDEAMHNDPTDEAMRNDPTDETPLEKQLIVVCPDGPLLVRGDFEIVSTSGEKLTRRRKTVALCRCGASAIKPYCDGSHKLIGFSTELEDPRE